jgi:O-antigen/teichoic acid export membrane protein
VSLIKKLANETVIYGIGQILPRILHYLVFSAYLTYRLNEAKAEYAAYLDMYAYASVLLIVFSLRLDTAFFRFGSREYKMDLAYSTAMLPLLGAAIFLVILGHLFALPIADWLTYPDKPYYVSWFAWIIALDILLLLPFGRMRLSSQPRAFVKYKVLNILVTIVLVFLFLEILPAISPQWPEHLGLSFIHDDISFVFLANLLASALLLIIFSYKYRPDEWVLDRVLLVRMLHYVWPLIIVGVAGSINQFFGVPLQKFFLGNDYEANKEMAGVYGAVQKIPALLALFTTAYNYAAEPFFFNNSEDSDSRTLYGDIAYFFIVATGLVAVGLMGFIDLAQVLIGPNYREGLFIVPILLMAYIFLGTYYNVSIWYKLSDKTHFGAIIAVVGMIITLVGSIVLLPIVGVIASAWVALICYVVMVIMAYVLGQQYYPINYPMRAILLQIGLITVLLWLANVFANPSLFWNMFTGTLIVMIYIVVTLSLEKKRFIQYGILR